MTVKVGLSFPAEVELSTSQILEAAKYAQAVGLDGVWVAEGRGGESFATLAALASATDSIPIGSAILPVFNRSPWLVAMGASVMDELAAGRFTLGLGVGHKAVVEGRHGLVYERPLARLRETTQIVRAALTGRAVDHDGSVFQIHGAQLSRSDDRSGLPIYLAATQPKSLRLAGELADGVFLILVTPGAVAAALRHVQDGARDAGRRQDSVKAVAYVFTCVDPEGAMARSASKDVLAYYGRLPHYQQVFRDAGFGAEADLLQEAWASNREDGARQAVNNLMVDAFTASGTAADVVAGLRRWADCGLDQIAIYPYPSAGQTSTTAFRRATDAGVGFRDSLDRHPDRPLHTARA